MTKTVCDICGADAVRFNECVIPRKVKTYAECRDVKLIVFQHTALCTVDLCDECAEKIANFISELEVQKNETN